MGRRPDTNKRWLALSTLLQSWSKPEILMLFVPSSKSLMMHARPNMCCWEKALPVYWATSATSVLIRYLVMNWRVLVVKAKYCEQKLSSFLLSSPLPPPLLPSFPCHHHLQYHYHQSCYVCFGDSPWKVEFYAPGATYYCKLGTVTSYNLLCFVFFRMICWKDILSYQRVIKSRVVQWDLPKYPRKIKSA